MDRQHAEIAAVFCSPAKFSVSSLLQKRRSFQQLALRAESILAFISIGATLNTVRRLPYMPSLGVSSLDSGRLRAASFFWRRTLVTLWPVRHAKHGWHAHIWVAFAALR
jgi:hypothetical protein